MCSALVVVLTGGQHSGHGEDLLDAWPQVQQERSRRSSKDGAGTGTRPSHLLLSLFEYN